MVKKSHERAGREAAKADEKTAAAASDADLLAEELAQLEAADAEHASQAAGAALVEPPDSTVERLEREVAEWKDRAMRASADFDNFRRRALKDRDEGYGRGQAEAYGKVAEVIDDLARVAHLDPAQTTAQSLHDGMLAIERKLLRLLETGGLERLNPLGQPFDPKTQEAISTMPAPTPEADQTVGAVYQAGYLFKGQLIRPARVVVQQWSGPPAGGDSPA